jgi:hypothetical protein
MVVVLPAPLVPRKPKTSPRSTWKSIPRTASWSPYFLRSPLTTIAGSAKECLHAARRLSQGALD